MLVPERSPDSEIEDGLPAQVGTFHLPQKPRLGIHGRLAMASYISFGDENQGYQVGINYGSICLPPGMFPRTLTKLKLTNNIDPERPETPPTPLSTVPFRRDPDFVSRDSLLDQIHKKVSVPGSRTSLVGIGGVGSVHTGQRSD